MIIFLVFCFLFLIAITLFAKNRASTLTVFGISSVLCWVLPINIWLSLLFTSLLLIISLFYYLPRLGIFIFKSRLQKLKLFYQSKYESHQETKPIENQNSYYSLYPIKQDTAQLDSKDLINFSKILQDYFEETPLTETQPIYPVLSKHGYCCLHSSTIANHLLKGIPINETSFEDIIAKTTQYSATLAYNLALMNFSQQLVEYHLSQTKLTLKTKLPPFITNVLKGEKTILLINSEDQSFNLVNHHCLGHKTVKKTSSNQSDFIVKLTVNKLSFNRQELPDYFLIPFKLLDKLTPKLSTNNHDDQSLVIIPSNHKDLCIEYNKKLNQSFVHSTKILNVSSHSIINDFNKKNIKQQALINQLNYILAIVQQQIQLTFIARLKYANYLNQNYILAFNSEQNTLTKSIIEFQTMTKINNYVDLESQLNLSSNQIIKIITYFKKQGLVAQSLVLYFYECLDVLTFLRKNNSFSNLVDNSKNDILDLLLEQVHHQQSSFNDLQLEDYYQAYKTTVAVALLLGIQSFTHNISKSYFIANSINLKQCNQKLFKQIETLKLSHLWLVTLQSCLTSFIDLDTKLRVKQNLQWLSIAQELLHQIDSDNAEVCINLLIKRIQSNQNKIVNRTVPNSRFLIKMVTRPFKQQNSQNKKSILNQPTKEALTQNQQLTLDHCIKLQEVFENLHSLNTSPNQSLDLEKWLIELENKKIITKTIVKHWLTTHQLIKRYI